LLFASWAVCAFAQNQQLEERLMAFKQNQAANKEKLALYIWTETETSVSKAR
jgi:DNA-binding SARP family transcriptional activator